MDRYRIALLISVLVAVATVYAAMGYNSPTFDEVAMLGGVASGVHTGRYDLVLAEPPLPPLVYSLTLRSVPMNFPPEPDETEKQRVGMCYDYARQLLWECGNDADLITFRTRMLAPLFIIPLGLGVYAFVRAVPRSAGGSPAHETRVPWAGEPPALRGTALQAAILTIFLPDVLGHAGLAYSDVPCTVTAFFAVWAIDSGLRRMRPQDAILAGVCLGAAEASKFSNLTLFGVAIVLLFLESRHRGHEPGFNRQTVRFMAVLLASLWATLACFFQDPTLSLWIKDSIWLVGHVEQGDNAFLLGQLSEHGFWYFFPVAFVLKTPVALHLLAIIAIISCPKKFSADSPWRAPIVVCVTLLAAYMHARLNIGFRHALPCMPWVCILIAVGCQRLGKGWLWGLTGLYVVSTLSWYPWFLSYVTEYNLNRDRGYRCLADSSVDWGQGLYALRRFAHDHGDAPIDVAYFGSALPDGFGIHTIPLPSFFKLQHKDVPSPPPQFLAVSATLMDGLGLVGIDWYGPLRSIEPDVVLGHTTLIFRTERPEVQAVLKRLHMASP